MPPTTFWLSLIPAGVMFGLYLLLMRGAPPEARTPFWKWSIVIAAGVLTTFCVGSIVHGSLPALWCVGVAGAGAAILGTVAWLFQRRVEDAQGGWRT